MYSRLCVYLWYFQRLFTGNESPPLLPPFPLPMLLLSPPLFSLPSLSRRKIGKSSRWGKSWSLVFKWGMVCLFGLHPHSAMWSHTWLKAGECTVCGPSTRTRDMTVAEPEMSTSSPAVETPDPTGREPELASSSFFSQILSLWVSCWLSDSRSKLNAVYISTEFSHFSHAFFWVTHFGQNVRR